MLEKQKDISLYVRHTLTGSLSQEIYLSHNSVVKSSGKKSGQDRILKNTELTYYIGTIPDDKLPKGAASGHFLAGELTLFKDSKISKVDKHKIFYHINNVSANGGSKKGDKSKAKKEEKSASSTENKENTVAGTSVTLPNVSISTKEDEKLKEAIRDTKVAWILK
jgi:hypothetical protein